MIRIYLVERFIGMFIYVLFLGLFTIIIRHIKKEQVGKILFVYSVLLSIMAFLFVPSTSSDLYRLRSIVQAYSIYDFKSFIPILINSGTPITSLYFYTIGKLNIEGLLPAITAFIFYTNVFYIIKNSAKKINSSSKDISLIVFYFMSAGVFVEVISGIRSMLALSIVALCYYKETFEKKSFISTVVFYIIALLIHPIATAVFIVRTVFLLFQKENKVIKRAFNLMVVGCVLLLLIILGYSQLVTMFEKSIQYFTNDIYFYFWEYLKAIIGLLIIIRILRYVSKIMKNNKDYINELNTSILTIMQYRQFASLITIVNVIFFFEYSTFHRLMTFNSIVTIPIFYLALRNRGRTSNYISNLIFFISVIMLLIAISRGNLSSYKFFIIQ